MFAFISQQPLPWQFGILFGIFVARSGLIAGTTTIWIHFSRWAQRRRIIAPKVGASVWRDVFFGIGILLLDAVVVLAAFRSGLMIGNHGSSLPIVLLTIAAFFVWVEIYFYYSHRLMHHPKLFWMHKHHHRERATNPWTSLSFSVVERFVLHVGTILIPALVSQFVPLSVDAYFAYFLINYLLNVYGHLNVETIPPWVLRRPWGQLLNTTTYHALHHSRYRGHFGLFTKYLDELHGTKFKDYERVHAEVGPR
ncbi:MAG: sterol desaturase family protein [Proteobacteria bacterium]|nr:MAG: sterol desaturase family protein [Pseudomonadota bacterium]